MGGGGVVAEREQTTIRLPKELLEKLKREADSKGYTVKDLIMFIIHDYFQNNFRE